MRAGGQLPLAPSRALLRVLGVEVVVVERDEGRGRGGVHALPLT